MTTKEDGSPSASSTFLPLARQLRRASVTSITSLFDKQFLNQTLDQIHNSASQSETLTTFNDYTSPPPSAVQKKPSNPGGGIGSWYSRMATSVTSTKSSKSGPDSAARVSTERSGDDASRSGQAGQGLNGDLSSSKISTAPSEAGPESQGSVRAPSRRSEYSQAADTKSLAGSTDAKPRADAVKPLSQGASHRSGPSLSSQLSASQVHLPAESESEGGPSLAGRKRARTPDPVPESPQIPELERSQTSLAPLSSSSITRNPSVSSSTSTRKLDAFRDQRRDSARSKHAGPEPSPTLTRFASAPHVTFDPGIGDTVKLVKDDGTGNARTSSKRSGSPDKNDPAIAALKRLHAQGLGSAASMNAQTQTVGATLSQLRNRVLSRQYWMKDENARDCFYCGDPFSTFRRKHHCRTCGQIFDAKCTTLVSGSSFGQSGNIRVCKPCEILINGYDDSSDYTDDDTVSIMTSRTKRRQGSRGDTSPARPSTPGIHGSKGPEIRSNLNTFKPHLHTAIGRRVIDDLKRTSGHYDDDSDRRSIRPTSSRSLKSSHGLRPHPGHRRHHSKHLHGRNPKTIFEEQPPFYRGQHAQPAMNDRLPAFHSDNVIDPDLAAYLSDDAETDDEDQSIAGALAGASKTRVEEGSASTPGATLKRPRSRYGESLRVLTGSQIDNDAMSVSSRGVSTPLRPFRRRNVSFTGSALQSSPPKPQRFSVAAQQWSSLSLEELNATFNKGRGEAGQMTRSVSMQGLRAPPVELNNASLQHGRRLLRQMLTESSVDHVDDWEKALMPILLRATDDVAPNVQRGDAINITNYVKLKKVPGGRMNHTAYVSGVVFSKNVALKSMKREIPNPNILILTFPLEFTRPGVRYSDIEVIRRQAPEFLEKLIGRIAILKPELLLVQRNVCGQALDMLDRAKITTVFNVKRSVLEAISRCCQVRIITSADKLGTLSNTHSSCDSFNMKTFNYEDRRKSYIYLAGCPRELGCTIVLRGASTSALRRVKRVAEFMLQAIYNLRLETSFMRDEFALIPEYGAQGTIRYEPAVPVRQDLFPANNDENSRPSTMNGETNEITQTEKPKEDVHADGEKQDATSELTRPVLSLEKKQSELPDDVPAPTFYSDLVEKQRDRILSTSPFVKFMQPYMLMRARESERRLTHLKRLLDQDQYELSRTGEPKPQKFSLITPEMINETVHGTSRKIREIIQAVHESEYDKATHIYKTQTRLWEASVSGNADMFNPLSHQSITVLHSLISTSSNIACTGPDVFTIRFYDDRGGDDGPEPDCTLGQYVEDTCVSADAACGINGCEKLMHEHHRHYVHGEGRLEVKIERSPPKAPGLDEIPLMWSSCRICGQETQTVPISANTWNYSFGKYLELAFWSIPLKPRAEICPHDIHHDHWRFFGYKNWAIRLQYDPVNILEVIVPRTRITWKVVNDLKFKNENFRKAERRLNKFVNSVKARLKSIRLDALLPEKGVECKVEIERLQILIVEDQAKILEKLHEKYEGSKFYEIVPFNRAMRMLHEKAGEWDEIFADFAEAFLPSETDIKRMALTQARKLLFGTEESGASIVSPEDPVNTSFSDDMVTTESPEGTLASASQSQIISAEKVQDLMTAVVEENSRDAREDAEDEKADFPASVEAEGETRVEADPEHPLVHHLDLAVTSPPSPHLARKLTSPVDPTPNLNDAAETSSDLKEEATALNKMVEEATTLAPLINGSVQPERPTSRLSGIPRAIEHIRHRSGSDMGYPSSRSQSQPAHVRQKSAAEAAALASTIQAQGANADGEAQPKQKRRLSQRLASLRTGGQSKIPRSVNRTRKESKVSALAKHFEQLINREFQQERMKDQKKRAARQRQAGAYPAVALKPVVEVYNDLREAVGEPGTDQQAVKPEEDDAASAEAEKSLSTAKATAANPIDQTDGDGFHAIGSKADQHGSEIELQVDGANAQAEDGQDTDGREDEPSSPTQSSPDTLEEPLKENEAVRREADLDDLDLDLPRHEKTSIMKMLTNFWAERSASGWEALYYPLRDVDHVFANSDIIVREDEPSSLIALALDHGDYQAQLKDIEEVSAKTRRLSDKSYVDDLFLPKEAQASIERSLLQDTGHHLSYQFERGPAKMQCKIFWAEQFQAVRKKCGVSERIVESLSRCLKWDSKGGKTKSVFLKTLDDRFVLKSLSAVETRSFLRFAPYYMNLMGEALFHDLPSLIAKMLGFYMITIRNPVTGTEFSEYLLLMENLFYDRSPDRTFDLKGSMRNRRIESTGEQNEVLLDENMVDYIAENPIFAREHSKKLLRASVYNDTLFLAKRNVMDYSLMLGIDEEKRELVVGIIDCIRTYTWDKKLETWVKDRGKNRPTVTEPKDYKNRFREAINRYVMETPNCWHFGMAQNLRFKNARTELAMQTQEQEEREGDKEKDGEGHRGSVDAGTNDEL